MSTFPSSLPQPVVKRSIPKGRVLVANVPGAEVYENQERDYSGMLQLEFFFNDTQLSVFYEWWRDETLSGGKYFNAYWSALWSGGMVCQFLKEPVFKHVYMGAYRVTMDLSVRRGEIESEFVYMPDLNGVCYTADRETTLGRRQAFLNAFPGQGIDGFESYYGGEINLETGLNPGGESNVTMNLAGVSVATAGTFVFKDGESIGALGRYPVDGRNYSRSSWTCVFNFSDPVDTFGFCLMDQGDFNAEFCIIFTFADGTVHARSLTQYGANYFGGGSGVLQFFGYHFYNGRIVKVQILSSELASLTAASPQDYIAIDLVSARPTQVTSTVGSSSTDLGHTVINLSELPADRKVPGRAVALEGYSNHDGVVFNYQIPYGQGVYYAPLMMTVEFWFTRTGSPVGSGSILIIGDQIQDGPFVNLLDFIITPEGLLHVRFPRVLFFEDEFGAPDYEYRTVTMTGDTVWGLNKPRHVRFSTGHSLEPQYSLESKQFRTRATLYVDGRAEASWHQQSAESGGYSGWGEPNRENQVDRVLLGGQDSANYCPGVLEDICMGRYVKDVPTAENFFTPRQRSSRYGLRYETTATATPRAVQLVVPATVDVGVTTVGGEIRNLCGLRQGYSLTVPAGLTVSIPLVGELDYYETLAFSVTAASTNHYTVTLSASGVTTPLGSPAYITAGVISAFVLTSPTPNTVPLGDVATGGTVTNIGPGTGDFGLAVDNGAAIVPTGGTLAPGASTSYSVTAVDDGGHNITLTNVTGGTVSGTPGFFLVEAPPPMCLVDAYAVPNPDHDPYRDDILTAVYFDGTEGGTDWVDHGPRALTITSFGTPTISRSENVQDGGALVLNGTTDYLTVGASETVNRIMGARFYISAWVKPSSSGVSRPIFSTRSSSTQGFTLGRNASNFLYFTAYATSGSLAVSTTTSGVHTIPQDVWTHVAVARLHTSSTGLILFVNGVPALLSSTGSELGGTGPFNIGREPSSGDLWAGRIGPVEFMSGAVRYQSAFPLPTAKTGTTRSTWFYSSTDVGTNVVATEDFTGGLDAYSLRSGTKSIFRVVTEGADQVLQLAFPGAPGGQGGSWIYRELSNIRPTRIEFFCRVDARAASGTESEFELYAGTGAQFVGSSAAMFTRFRGTASPRFVPTVGVWYRVVMQKQPGESEQLARWYTEGGTLVWQGWAPATVNAAASKAGPVCLTFYATTWLSASSLSFKQIKLIDDNYARTVLSIRADASPLVDSTNIFPRRLELTNSAVVSTAQAKFGPSSIYAPNSGSAPSNGVLVKDCPEIDFAAEDFTIEMWVYKLPHANTAPIFQMGRTSPYNFMVYVNSNGSMVFACSTDGVNGSGAFATALTTAAGVFASNQWNFLSVQRRGANFEFHLNGTLLGTRAVAGGISATLNSTGDFALGRFSSATNDSLGGYFDNVWITRNVAKYGPGNYTVPPVHYCAPGESP